MRRICRLWATWPLVVLANVVCTPSTGSPEDGPSATPRADAGEVDASTEPALDASLGSPDGGLDAAASKPSLFAPDSPWNVEATGEADPASDAFIASGKVGSLAHAFAQSGKTFDIAGTDAYPDYGVPVALADTATPKVPVTASTGWWPGFDAVPIPPSAQPAVGTDHHLVVMDSAAGVLWEFWDMKKSAGSWSAGAGVKFDAHGPGYQTKPGALSARAYGGSLAGGLIRHEEMMAGVISHALAMAYPWTRGHSYALGIGVDGVTQNIACHSDNAADANRNTATNIPEGARFRLKATVDVESRCKSNAACATIGHALSRYGAYVVDTAGVAVLYAEVLTGTGRSWAGLLDIADARAFQSSDFELLALPQSLTAMP